MPIETIIENAINATITMTGNIDAVISNPGGSIGDLNAAAQVTAGTAALVAGVNPAGSSAAFVAGFAAVNTATASVASDISEGHLTLAVADSFTVLGDEAIMVGGLVGVLGAQGLGNEIDKVAGGAVLASVAFNHLDTVAGYPANPAFSADMMADLVAASGAMGGLMPFLPATAGSSLSSLNSNAFSSIVTALNDIGGANFSSDMTGVSNALNAFGAALVTSFGNTGQTAPNITDTVTGTSSAITTSNTSLPAMNGTSTSSASGSSTGLDSTGDSSALAINESDTIGTSSVTDTTQSNNPNGTVQYTQTITTPSTGQVSESITGSGDATGISDAAISIAAGAVATVAGNANSIAAAAGAATTVNGNSNTVTGGSSNTILANGLNDTINGVSGDTVGISGNGANGSLGGDYVNMNSGSINLATNSGAVITGNSNTIDGNGSSVAAIVNGDSNTINGMSGDTVNVSGNGANGSSGGDFVNMSSGTINLATNSGAVITGNSNTIGGDGSSAAAVVSGDSNIINGVSGDTVNVSGNGANGSLGGDYVNMDSGTINLAANSGAVITGNSNTIGGDGSSAAAIVSGDSNTINGVSGDTVNVSGNGANGSLGGDYVNMNSGTINLATNSGAVVTGSSNTISTGGTSDAAVIDGSSNVMNGTAGATFDITGGTDNSATLTGSGDNASFGSANTGTSLTATSVSSGETVTTNVTQGTSGTLTFSDTASGSGTGTYNFSGSGEETGVSSDSFQNDGTYLLDTANLVAGGSVASLFNPTNQIIETVADYTGANDSGTLSQAGIELSPFTISGTVFSGITVGETFDVNSSDDFQQNWNIPVSGGSVEYSALFTPTGSYISGDDGGILADDGGYGDGGEFEIAQSTGATGASGVNLTQFDSTLPQNNAIATEDAQVASQEIDFLSQAPALNGTSSLTLVSAAGGVGASVPTAAINTDAALYEGAKWNGSNVITWSVADSAAPADSPFSSYMGSQYEALVEKAFQAWATASGLTFEEVADSSQSDIRLGWGDFDTSSSSVVGYTTYQTHSGQLQPDAIIRLEDPTQTSLVTGTDGTATYSGTDADLYQVLLHEIGHALGLADNNDSNSVMYYKATGANKILDSSDVNGMQTLYGTQTLAMQALQGAASELSGTASINSLLQQLVQATASFQSTSSVAAPLIAQQAEATSTALAIPQHS